MRALFFKGAAAADRFWNGRYYFPALLMIACLGIITDASLVCVCVLLLITALLLVFCGDLLSVMLPVALILPNCVGYYRDFSAILPYALCAAVPTACALIFHLIYYRRPMRRGLFTLPLAAVSAALLLGGVGYISAQEYFEPIALYYTLALGVAQLALYALYRSRLQNTRAYDRPERLARIIYCMGLVFALVIFVFYVRNFDRLLERGSVLFFKPRNYLSSVFLMSIPTGCILCGRNKKYFIGMALMYIAMLLSGSRSGLIFGTLIMLICAAYLLAPKRVLLKKHKRTIVIVSCVLAVAAAGLIAVFYADRFANGAEGDATRIKFIKLGLSQFLAHPIFGVGIGCLEGMELFKAKVPGTILFYHNLVIQVPASTGLVGMAAYMWAFWRTIRLFWRDRRDRRLFPYAISYFGLLLMSLTNPGIFCPFPELALLVIMLAVTEEESNKNKYIEEEKE